MTAPPSGRPGLPSFDNITHGIFGWRGRTATAGVPSFRVAATARPRHGGPHLQGPPDVAVEAGPPTRDKPRVSGPGGPRRRFAAMRLGRGFRPRELLQDVAEGVRSRWVARLAGRPRCAVCGSAAFRNRSGFLARPGSFTRDILPRDGVPTPWRRRLRQAVGTRLRLSGRPAGGPGLWGEKYFFYV